VPDGLARCSLQAQGAARHDHDPAFAGRAHEYEADEFGHWRFTMSAGLASGGAPGVWCANERDVADDFSPSGGQEHTRVHRGLQATASIRDAALIEQCCRSHGNGAHLTDSARSSPRAVAIARRLNALGLSWHLRIVGGVGQVPVSLGQRGSRICRAAAGGTERRRRSRRGDRLPRQSARASSPL